ncbi:MAG: FAD:protein FMN transferase [bacterium]|nr:FAD:protein FMN transferase [bacterium]
MNEPGLHRFAHEAMATTFEIVVSGQDQEYARQAAAGAFRELDRLESQLSRFIESSDISRINHLKAGAFTRVSAETFDCLKLAVRLAEETGGAFDVTIGPLMACWRTRDGQPRTPSPDELAAARARVGAQHLQFDDASVSVGVDCDGVQVDLGGMGKGVGIDLAASTIREWSIERAMVDGGESTVLAMEPPEGESGWVLGVGGSRYLSGRGQKATFVNRALSGSGVELQKRHIIDPHRGEPVSDKLAAWAACPEAAEADALSTAFMVMPVSEIEAFCERHPEVSAMVLEGRLVDDRPVDIRLRTFGGWDLEDRDPVE